MGEREAKIEGHRGKGRYIGKGERQRERQTNRERGEGRRYRRGRDRYRGGEWWIHWRGRQAER